MTRIGNGGEQDLVRDIQRGDRVAMKLLYCRYAGCLTAVCSRYVACMDDVRDVLQDCFVKIFTSIHGFEWRGEGSLRGWMVRIVIEILEAQPAVGIPWRWVGRTGYGRG